MSIDRFAGRMEEIFETARVGWFLQQPDAPPREKIRAEMAEVSAYLRQRLGRPVDIEQVLLSDLATFAPLVQTFSCPMSTVMRAMVFCLLDDAEMSALRYEYKAFERTRLVVEIHYRRHGQTLVFESDDHWDTEVLQHLGFAEVDGRPFLDGYYGTGR